MESFLKVEENAPNLESCGRVIMKEGLTLRPDSGECMNNAQSENSANKIKENENISNQVQWIVDALFVYW